MMFITENERLEIIKWVMSIGNTFYGNPQSKNSVYFFGKAEYGHHEIPQFSKDIKRRVIKHYHLENELHENVLGDFCCVVDSGGDIHRHVDMNHGNLTHVRFNVIISKAVRGGVPINNGIENNVDEGEVFITKAGKDEHWCTVVEGSKPRITLSYGFFVSDETLKQL